MSMMARFVEVTPGRMAQLLNDPSSVDELFEEDATPLSAVQLTDSMRQEFARRAQQLLGGTLTDPRLRNALAQRLGVDAEVLQSGAGADAILKAMEQRGLVTTAGVTAQFAGGPETPGWPSKPVGRKTRDQGRALSLEKAWHGVHYLLCGQVDTGSTILGQAIMGGAELGEDFSGYGPARYFTVEKVAETARELARADLEAEMKSRFDPAEMSRLSIYPFGWDSASAEWLFEGFHRLRDFYADSSARQCAVLTCIV